MPAPLAQVATEICIPQVDSVPLQGFVNQKSECVQGIRLARAILSDQSIDPFPKGEPSVYEVPEVPDAEFGYMHERLLLAGLALNCE
jgi:hypothetical protein